MALFTTRLGEGHARGEASPVLGIGWDVGGWMGKKQAVAALQWDGHGRTWCGTPRTFDVPELYERASSTIALLRVAWPDLPKNVLERFRVVIAIDAPLGFPVSFRKLVTGESPTWKCPDYEIQNRFAYRETERHVYDIFHKKPLSATFDKLGNNATVALTHARRWRDEESFTMLPFADGASNRKVIIEVYPALVKLGDTEWVKSRFGKLLPSDLKSESDERDAAICALMAVAFAAEGKNAEFPPMIGPPTKEIDVYREEGWIYYPDPAWLRERAE